MRLCARAFMGVLILSLMAWTGMDAGAQESHGKSSIVGSLIKGVTQEKVPNMEVFLKRYEGDQEKEAWKTVTDAEGKFHFQEPDHAAGQNYFVHVLYKDVEYYSPPIVFSSEQREIPVQIALYEPTDSDKNISIATHHVLLEPAEGQLWVTEVMIVENKGDRVYVGSHEIAPGKKETLRISLPPRAQELQIGKGLMACCVVKTDSGFSDTRDIKPGRKEIQFRYRLDYEASRLSLEKKIDQTTGSIDFFIPDQGTRVNTENLRYTGLMGEPGRQFLHFTGKELTKGTQVALNMESLPEKKISFKFVAPVAGVMLFAFGLALPLVRRWRSGGKGDVKTGDGAGRPAMPQEERRSLLLAMARMDDQLESGQISQEEHEKRRRVLKEKVLALTETSQRNGPQARKSQGKA